MLRCLIGVWLCAQVARRTPNRVNPNQKIAYALALDLRLGDMYPPAYIPSRAFVPKPDKVKEEAEPKKPAGVKKKKQAKSSYVDVEKERRKQEYHDRKKARKKAIYDWKKIARKKEQAEGRVADKKLFTGA